MVLQCINFIIQSQEIKYIIQTSRSKWKPYNISVPLDLKVTLKDTRLIQNIIYVWKLNQTVLELDFRAVKLLFLIYFISCDCIMNSYPIQYIKSCWVRLLSNYNIKYICTIYTRLLHMSYVYPYSVRIRF
jgi:hypothetical protein